MKVKRQIRWLFIAWLIPAFSTITYAQSIGPQVINSCGSSTSTSGHTFEWSIGELVIHTASGESEVYTQGLLQPIFVEEVSIDNPEVKDEQLMVYPNPADFQVFVQPRFLPNSELSMVLIDVTGRVMYHQATTKLLTGKEKQTIGLSALASGSYLLNIEIKEALSVYHKTFKIQKQ